MKSICQLAYGRVTQNGNYISYKTHNGTDSVSFYQECISELIMFCNETHIIINNDFSARHSDNSISRKGAVTIKVSCQDFAMSKLPYEGDSLN